MTISIVLQFIVVLAAIWMGARYSGVGLGLWGAVGLLVLVVAFGVNPTSPPVDVMLIILAVIMAASVMDAAGGIDFLVRIAERVIRANPKYVTIVAPITTWCFTFVAGTGHIVYPLLPVIYETAHQNGIRPERPMAVATIASQQAITASPVAAATAAMIGLFSEKGLTQWGLPEILMVCVPASLTGVVVAAIVSMFIGKDLKDDPEYQARLAAGEIPAPLVGRRAPAAEARRQGLGVHLPRRRRAGRAVRLLPGAAHAARREERAGDAGRHRDRDDGGRRGDAAGDQGQRRRGAEDRDAACRRGRGDRHLRPGVARRQLHRRAQGRHRAGDRPAGPKRAPWTFAFGLFFASVLLYSQAATTRALMPLGIALGIPPQFLIAMFPSVNGYFFIPTYGSLIAAINFDLSGTTRIGKYVLNHSFMIPGLVATAVTVATGLFLAKIMF